MIDKYDEFRRRMQMLLLKKEQEYGPLKYLLFRTTEETSGHIDDLIQAIVDVLHRLELIPQNTTSGAEKSSIIDDQNAIKCYYYILLNTNFSSQQLLIEDPVVGHLVGVCPALSPYVFIQIIWSLNYEEILCESLQHMPLDLCVEVLEIAVKCVTELESTRDVNLLFNLANTIYFTCLKLHLGAVSQKNATECANQLVAIFHTVLDQISEFACSSDLPKRTRYERHGHLVKRILRNTQLCAHWKTLASVKDSDKAQVGKLHELTYGDLDVRERYFHTLAADEVRFIVTALDQELVNLLLREIKRVDCNEYFEWADIDDAENGAILLQRAVAIECHHFMEFTRHDEFLAQNEHLRQCLQQLMGSSSDKFRLSVEEICYGIDHGRPEGMKELLRRYQDWSQSTLDFIGEKTHLLEGRDYNVLFDYLHHVFGCPRTESEKRQAYTSVLRIVLQQDLLTMFSVVTTYIVQHFDNNCLEYLYNQEAFEKFIARNEFVHDAHGLRTLLVFTLLNARAAVTTLVRIATGCYEHVMFAPRDILLLRPLFQSYRIKYGDRDDLLTSAIRTVCLENSKWSAMKFGQFMQVIVDSQLTHPDDLMNDVFIPYLFTSTYEWSNLLFVTTYVHNVIKERRCSSRTDYTLLYKALVKRQSLMRRCNPFYARGPVNNIMLLLRRTLHILLAVPDALTENGRRQVTSEIGNSVEPLDRELNGHVMDVIQNYERRCLPVYRRLTAEPALRDCTRSLRLDREALIRHMMLHASTKEFEVLALQLTTVFWFTLGWADELDAFENVARIAADAARLASACDRLFPQDTLVTLLQAIVRYCSRLADIGHVDLRTIRRVLVRAMSSLRTAVGTCYRETYKPLLARVTLVDIDKFDSNKRAYFDEIEKWIDVYLVKRDDLMPEPRESGDSDEESRAPELEEVRGMINAYTFVCRCVAVPVVSEQISANWVADFIFRRQKERSENVSRDEK